MMVEVISSAVGALTLAVYLMVMRKRYGVPEMISSTYYQGGGVWFTLVMWVVALTMMVATLGSGVGAQFLAFLGCGGLMFVGAAPKFLDKDERPIHKGGAIVSAFGCVGWCLTANPIPTVVIGGMYATYLLLTEAVRLVNPSHYGHTWLLAELSAFMDTFVTLWSVI